MRRALLVPSLEPSAPSCDVGPRGNRVYVLDMNRGIEIPFAAAPVATRGDNGLVGPPFASARGQGS